MSGLCNDNKAGRFCSKWFKFSIAQYVCGPNPKIVSAHQNQILFDAYHGPTNTGQRSFWYVFSALRRFFQVSVKQGHSPSALQTGMRLPHASLHEGGYNDRYCPTLYPGFSSPFLRPVHRGNVTFASTGTFARVMLQFRGPDENTMSGTILIRATATACFPPFIFGPLSLICRSRAAVEFPEML